MVLDHINSLKSAHLMRADVKSAFLFDIKRLLGVPKGLCFRDIQRYAYKPTKKHTVF